MRLRLTVTGPEGHEDDLAISCDDELPASELIESMAREIGLSARDARAARTGRGVAWAADDTPVGRLDLRDGDRIELLRSAGDAAKATAGYGDALVDLVVVGGPAAGRRLALREGVHVVGRGPGAEVTVEDRSMSRRHLRVAVGRDGVTVADAGSSNGSFVDGAALHAPRRLVDGEIVEAGRTSLTVEPHDHDVAVAPTQGGRIAFNRPPRVARPAFAELGPLPGPPAEHDAPKLPIGAAAVPLVLGVSMALITGNLMLLSFVLLTPAMAMWSYVEGRRTGGRRHRTAVESFRAAVASTAAQLREARRAEADARRSAAPDAAALHRRAAELRPDLWERRLDDDDALELRVGTADLPSEIAVELPSGGDPAMREEARAALDQDACLTAMPVTVPLMGEVIGIAGGRAEVAGLARWLVVQAATLHSPAELAVVAAVGADADAEWDWLKWLPHVHGGDLVTGSADGRAVLADVAEHGRPALVVVDGDLRLEPALIAAAASGGGVICLGRRAHQLPATCTWIADLDRDVSALELVDVRRGVRIRDVTADVVGPAAAEEVARLLAPVDDAGAGDPRGAVPDRASLLDLLGIEPSAAAIAERWRDRRGDLRAPLGRAADGPFEIDVGGKEGLRLLLAGMPGAGKSELLQALIASLAATHPPDRLTFLLVDYKGGAAFQDCVGLPHAVGIVTDLDEHLADRSRASLLAELRRREALLSANGAKSLRELTRRDPEAAPPTLVIVVDEFATLVREVPAFVDTVVDLAQRGRSLGLHLVLATQRPRGAVSDAIRANTNLRIAMRVSDRAESEDVIEAPDAAAIPASTPGRAIALSGRRPDGSPALVPFQAAYAGGRTTVLAEQAVRVEPLRFGGWGGEAAPAVSQVGGGAATDLQLLVAAVRRAAADSGVRMPAVPWMPPLPERLSLDDLLANGQGEAPVALLDEPTRQRQRPFGVDLARDGSLLVYGASGSGKTVLLQTLACALAERSTPRDLQIYGLDYGSGALGAIEALPHCGSVIRGDEEERVLRLLGGLGRALAQRKQTVSGTGRPGPEVVLLVDGYGAFSAALERIGYGEPVGLLARLAAEGRPLGIHVVVTADRRADVPGSLSGVVPGRIVLRLADADEYAALGLPRNAVAGATLPPGRGFQRDGTELQVALPGDLAARGKALHARSGRERAPAIGTLPARVPRDRLPGAERRLEAVLGIDDETLQPIAVDLADGPLVVSGPYRSGRTTALATIATSLRRGTPDAALHLLAPRRSQLAALGVWASASSGPEEATAAAERLAREAEPLVVFVDDATELAEGPAGPALEALVRRSRDEEVRLVVAVETHAAQRVFGGWLRDLRAEGRGILLTPNLETDGELLGVRLPRRGRGPFPPGRGFIVLRGVSHLVQVAGE